MRIMRSCHIDPTAGHLGEKKTIAKISERFSWTEIVKDAKQMVYTSFYSKFACTLVSALCIIQISTCDFCQKVNRKLTSKKPELYTSYQSEVTMVPCGN